MKNKIFLKLYFQVISFSIITFLFAFSSFHYRGINSEKSKQKITLRNDSIGRIYDPNIVTKKALRLDTFFNELHQLNGFNGTVLVSQYGKIIYKKAFGLGDFENKDSLTTSTPFQLASVSKQFTAVAIIQLKEKGLLDYDQSVKMFIPNFPYDSTITIRSLLTHRSGIPDYTYAFDKIANKKAPLSSQQVVEMFAKYKPKKYFNANQNYSYNNSNYVVLANIVERITGLSFRKYAQKNLFEPCGMKNSFIYDPENPEQVAHAARGYNSAKSSKSYPFDFLDGAVGDKGVYSTVEDLYLWDMALNSEKLVKLSSLENDAFQPAHTFKAPTTRNYGFGWRLQLLDDGSWLTYHTGWWHGFKNYYMHNRKDNSSIICLGNIANNSLSKIKIAQSILYPEKAWYFMDGMNYTHQIE